MTSYLFSLLAASLAAALIGILSPGGEGSGIGRHLKLLTALFLVAVLISPLQTAVEQIIAFANGDLTLPGLEQTDTPDYREEMDQALTGASKTYITQLLTQTLEQEFSILPGEVRCHILWNDGGQDTLTPNRVTVLLSGKAIWKDPAPIRQFVSDLLGCECRVAIE
ncbi:MAG: hypothetical protein IJX62_04820 [Clostridia bacterium]|nr:hypothetical protein [Clostridia bacterium]